ncbi:MAG: divalent-cation tolerance protein CutA [Alkalilacustris sp.]
MAEVIEIEITCPDMASAEAVARACVEARLAACANIRPGLRSIYRWQGAVETEAEVGLMLKTRTALFDRVVEAVARTHPYEVPAIVAVPLVAVAPSYAAWLRSETGG